jgi:3-hydroxyacyl-[acyl-carrier-protein] dehydratase
MEQKDIIATVLNKIPHQPPFRFIDEITYLDDTRIEGNYFLNANTDFYKGHFPEFPVTPGVILTEIMAQIGMVAFGIYLMMLGGETAFTNMATLLTETNIKFKKQVLPGQKIFVRSEKILFRHGKLQCNVSLKNSEGNLLCFGTMSGMLFIKTQSCLHKK